MKGKLLFFVASLMLVSGLLTTGSGLAYYYPSTGNIPPGPPPNYNQVDTTYFLGIPQIPFPPPDDRGGFYVYYDQGIWNVANHIYSPGDSYEQFHGCVLVVLSQPPTLGVNVFAEQFELDVPPASNCDCLRQNDRWGWIPWGDNLYEIWWDVTTKDWKDGQGDPNDFMRFRISGCAVDFNLWSSGHGDPFGPDQIYLGANKTPLSLIFGFTDTYPGIDDPYQSQAGDIPIWDPNTTIFTWKSDTLRSYNKLGLIDSTDSYNCYLALQYGKRYAGTFAYEGNGVQFSTSSLCPPNQDPSIFITPDTSVFICADDSVMIWIFASDPDADDTITVEKVYGMGDYPDTTDLTSISDQFYFHPDTGGIHQFIFRVTDQHGATDEDTSFIAVILNRPPQLTCPQDDTVEAGEFFTSSDYSLTDPDGTSGLTVVLHSISPAPTNAPGLVDSHVEWLTTGDDLVNGPDFTITLIATDSCEAADTCDFGVTVSRPPVIIIVPDDDSVHAGDYFISTDFSVIESKAAATVNLCGVTPPPTHQPIIVDSHIEWQTECADDGKIFAICLEAVGDFGAKDTGYFHVTVYNRPPELTCPEDGSVEQGQTFVSNDFSVTDPDDDPVTVSFLDINPSAANDPYIVDDSVEWITTAADELGEYTIRLIAKDHCELADTCEFTVRVDERTGVFECPDDDSVHAGNYFISTDFSLTHPDCDPSSVEVLEVNPSVTNMPFILDYHVEWQTTCDEDGDYIITLTTGAECPTPDTCSFTVTVYNRPPELTCPDYGQVEPMDLFISTDFFVTDPDGDDVSVYLLGIDPPAEYDPIIVERHVEWQTACVEGDYIITLMAADPCGLADTCEFMVSVYRDLKPDFYIWVYPITQYVAAGQGVGYLVELNSMLGFAKPCSLYVSGLPDPPNSGVFYQVVMTPTEFTTLNVYTAPETDTGTYTLTVTGKEISGPVMHSTQVYLTVGEPLDVGDEAESPNAPKSFTLFQNQPNPFNPETQISYYLTQGCQVRVSIYNVLGQRMKTLYEGYQGVGMHTLMWDGRSEDGIQLSSGIYFYQLQADSFQETKKMILMK